jgi:hypothetical protein
MFFFMGYMVSYYKIWPQPLLNLAMRVASSLMKFGVIAPDNLIIRAPPGASRERFTIYQRGLVQDGYYGLLGWDESRGTYSAWLYDATGKLLHTWELEYRRLDPDGPRNGGDAPHAFWILPDGSFLVSFDWGDVMARVDPCGKAMWTRIGTFHHSLERAEDGSFWTWRGDGTAHGHRQWMVNFDPETGKTLRELELKDVIRKMGPLAIAFGVPADFKFMDATGEGQVSDIFHPNDVEPLPSALAPQFPAFEAGDLLVSIREPNLVAVIGPDDLRVKWWRQGPWVYQHDPDFLPDGTISVYDNNKGRDRSEIIKINPTTGAISNELHDGGVPFYSEEMGSHQYLPNGNVFIVVPGEGRALELTKDGHKVLEFNNVFRAKPSYNAHVANGMWLDKGYFQKLPACPAQ